MKEKITISEIAKRSGVSLATVSLALNNRPGISAETRERVLETASELGYIVKPSGQFSCGSLKTIGMVVKTDRGTTPQANPFYSKVLIGIEDTCRRIGINLLFATLPVDNDNRALEIPPMVYNGMVDGLLVVGTFVDETIDTFSGNTHIPLVLVDGYSNSERFDAVVSDNFHAAYQAVEYLIQKGHRQIGLVGSEENSYPSIKERRNGYLRALKMNNISKMMIAPFNINKSHGFNETTQLLQEHPEITALFCVNDDAAAAAMKAAQALGRNIPADLSVIGYDDTYIAANTVPTLTTMHVDTLALGRAAVHLLALRAENPDTARMTCTIHPLLVERESVAPLKS